MMPRHLWMRLAPPVSFAMIASCAASPPPSVAPPRLALPEAAIRPCVLERLPETPTEGDLEVAYVARGAALVACESAREMAVGTLRAERDLQDRWRQAQSRRRRSWLW